MKIAFYQFIQQQKKTVLLICLLGTIFFSQASGKTVMYGTTQYGGANGKGTIFEYDPVAHTYTAKYSFDGTNGSYPMGSLLEYNGKFYGLTSAGGPRNLGVLFEFNPVNYAYAVIDSFNGVKKGAVPYGSLTLFQNKLYGMTKNGGILDEGVIFFYDPAAGVIKKLWDFNDVTYGKNPYGSLVVYNNTLYGYTTNGGASGNGLMFYWSFEDSTGVKVSDLAAMYGKPYGTPVLYNNKLWGTFRTGGSYNKGALYSFCGVGCGFDLYNEFSNTYHTDGDYPECSVVIYNGKLYGTTTTGGSNGSYGTLYECSLTSPFTFAVKYNFKNDALGYYPCGGLTQYNGKIYGVTRYSNSSAGSIFEYSPSTGTMTNSVAMTSANGYNPGYTTLVPYNVRYKLSVRVFDGATELKDAVVTLTSNNRKVPYNSTAYSMDTVSGIYYYQISKPGYVTKTGAFTIADANYSEGITLSASPVPFITVNTGLSILEGNTLIIPSGKLAAADMQQGASSLTFTVTSAPTHGRLEKTNNAGTAISSFTQDDINNSLIQYVNDGITGTSDGFSFTVDDGTGNTTAVTTFTITVTAVNDAPGFTKGDDVTVNENVSTQTITNWATSISKGGSDESSQTLSFRVTNDNNSLFYTQPSISSSGTLTFRPATNAYGTAIVSVRLGDNGGRVNGGVDSSDVKTFLITVVQPPFMTVSTNSLNIAGSSAGTFSFNINSNISWSVTCSQSWIQLQTSSGSGNNTINITAIDNPATSERTASITVTGGNFTETISVKQAAGEPALSVSKTAVNITAASSTFDFDISSNTLWVVSTSASWLSYTTTSGNGNSNIVFTAEKNSSTNQRYTTITITGAGTFKTITVTQAAADPILEVQTNPISLASLGGSTAFFDIVSNTDWTISCSETWLNISPKTGNGNKNITVTAASSNTTSSVRGALLTISVAGITKTLNVTQAAADPTLEVQTNPISLASPGGSTASFNIVSNTDWTISCPETWLNISPKTGNGNGNITVTAASSNTTSSDRGATLTISAAGITKTLNVTQVSSGATLSVSATSLSIGSTANSTATFDITSNSSWTINSSESWLTVSQTSGSNNATITVNAESNTTSNSRSAVITVSIPGLSSKTITVSQASGPTGISETVNENIRIYPNPAINKLYVESENPFKEDYIAIFTTSGTLVASQKANNKLTEIDLSKLAPGIYLVKINDRIYKIVKKE